VPSLSFYDRAGFAEVRFTVGDGHSQHVVDTLALNDRATYRSAHHTADIVTIADSITKDYHRCPITDEITIVSTVMESNIFKVVNLFDSANITDSLSTVASHHATYTDSISLLDTVYYTSAHVTTISDLLILLDQHCPHSLSISILSCLSVYITDRIISRSLSHTYSDILPAADSVNKKLKTVAILDILTIADIIIAGHQQYLSIIDYLVYYIADQPVRRSTSHSALDIASIADSIITLQTRALTESVTIFDSITKYHPLTLSDIIPVIDAYSRVTTTYRYLADYAATVTDKLTAASSLSKSDLVAIADSITKDVAQLVSDTYTFDESITKSTITNLSDYTLIADLIVKSIPALLYDHLDLGDYLSNSHSYIASDTVSMYDIAAHDLSTSVADRLTIIELLDTAARSQHGHSLYDIAFFDYIKQSDSQTTYLGAESRLFTLRIFWTNSGNRKQWGET
jgi:hypothetical protein